LLTGDAEAKSAQSLNSDPLTDAGSDLDEAASGKLAADSLLWNESQSSYQIGDILPDRALANLGYIPNFEQQNVGLHSKAESSEFVNTNLLINSTIAPFPTMTSARDFKIAGS
jgi:hypothetical protein